MERRGSRRSVDNDEEETPRRTRRVRDEEDERPARRSARNVEDEQPRRRRGFSGPDNMDTDYDDDLPDGPTDDDGYEEDEEETPRRTRSTRRATRDIDEDDDRPSRTTRSRRSGRDSGDRERDDSERTSNRSRVFHESNMKTYKQKVAESTLRYRRYVVKGKKEQPFAFLEPEPFANFFRHWVGKRPYTCLGDICPLCDAGDRSKPVLMYNIYDFDDDQVKVWELSKEPAKKVEKRYDALEAKGKFLNSPGVFFTVSKDQTGDNGGSYVYDVQLLSPEDMEYLEIEPLSKSEVRDLKLYDDSIVYVNKVSELEEAIDKLEY